MVELSPVTIEKKELCDGHTHDFFNYHTLQIYT